MANDTLPIKWSHNWLPVWRRIRIVHRPRPDF